MTERPASLARDLMPSSALPLGYYLFAHACLLGAFLLLAVNPGLPGASFYHPRFAALVHLVTLGWIAGSILGSFYIVGPLALGIPMKAGHGDWGAFGSFVMGTCVVVSSFWAGRYDGVAIGGTLATIAIGWVAARAAVRLPRSTAPIGVTVHVALAFANILGGALLAILLALDRSRGFLGLSPLGVTFAHAHIAAVGFATMMVVGLAYRLIPMMLPAAMPTGRGLAASAVLIEAGLGVLVITLLGEGAWASAGWVLVAGGLVSFAMQMRRAVSRRMPRPPALPARDWSTWQAHSALLWLLFAMAAGAVLSVGASPDLRLPLMWIYGVAGLVGFLGQIVAGIQGRLVPFYAWYRAFAALGRPPARAANALPSAGFARAIFSTWTAGLFPLAAGLALQLPLFVAAAGVLLAVAVILGAAYLLHMLRSARV